MEVHYRRKSKRISKEKINLIVSGVLPATTDLQKYHLESVKKHPDVLAIGHVIHDHREEQVLYNKKFKNLIDRCQKNSWNSKEFGKLLGYTNLIDLRKIDYKNDVIVVNYSLNNKGIISFWKNKSGTEMKKELELLQKMRNVNPYIEINIHYESP